MENPTTKVSERLRIAAAIVAQKHNTIILLKYDNTINSLDSLLLRYNGSGDDVVSAKKK